MTNEDIETMLSSEGMLKVKKLGGNSSLCYKIIFNMIKRPDRIKVFGDRRSFPIRAYIPPPLRCYKCQKYDHASSTCRLPKGEYICQRCGGNHQSKIYKDGKLESECDQEMKCCHCKQKHEAGYIKCPTQISYVEVNKLMVNEKITRHDAKTRVFSQYARSDAKMITSAIRVEESKKEVEETRQHVADSKVEIVALNNKLETFMTEVRNSVTSSPASNQEANIEVMVKQAVESATKKIQEASDKKFEKIQKQLLEQTSINKKNYDTIASLTSKNSTLEGEVKKLREQLAKAQATNAELKKNQTTPKPIIRKPTEQIVPKQIDPNKTGVKRLVQSNSIKKKKMIFRDSSSQPNHSSTSKERNHSSNNSQTVTGLSTPASSNNVL